MIVRGPDHKSYFNRFQCFFMNEDGPLPGPRKMRWMVIVTYFIGISLCLSGALMFFLDIGPLPVRITMGILGFALISSSNPIAKALMD
jgi:hypothetical protein